MELDDIPQLLLGDALRHFFRQKYEKIWYVIKQSFFLGRFKLLRVRNDAKLIGEDVFPPGMGLQLVKNVQKLNLSVKFVMFSKCLPKIIKNHGV